MMAHQHPPKSPRTRSDSGWRLVKIAVVLIVLAVCGNLLWQLWPRILVASINWQREIINQMSSLLYTAMQSRTAMISLVEISFLYGIFHSLGPGHGKLVVSTYLATHPTKVKVSLAITIVSAMVQALVAIGIVSVFLLVVHTTIRHANAAVGQFFKASYLGVFLLGVYIVYQGVQQYLSRRKHVGHAHHHHDHHDHDHHDHHDGTCQCGHKHVATPADLNRASSMKEYIAIVLSIGIRPCTGAILILFFAHMAQMYWLGVMGALLMAVGTACTTSTIALMTVSGRKIVQRYLTASGGGSGFIWPILRIIAGLLLILVSYLLMQQGVFGMSPIFRMS
jgi:nickel/cobalt exporter